jgi:transcriptional regulator with XRE-family HTH domain
MSEFHKSQVEKEPETREMLKGEFSDPEYRYGYSEDFLNTSIAVQIRVLREQRGLTQEELALAIGTKQAGISRLENVNYSAWKTQTLRKLARALGVRLKITFETFGTLLDDAAEFGRESLQRADFDSDPVFHETSAPEVHEVAMGEAVVQAQAVLSNVTTTTGTTTYRIGLGIAPSQIEQEVVGSDNSEKSEQVLAPPRYRSAAA